MRWAIALFVLFAACATMKSDTTVCPEFRELRCLSDTECTMDNQRGCQVCRCAPVHEDQSRPARPDETIDPSGQTR